LFKLPLPLITLKEDVLGCHTYNASGYAEVALS